MSLLRSSLLKRTYMDSKSRSLIKPIVIGNMLVSPSMTLLLVTVASYMSLIASIYLLWICFFSRTCPCQMPLYVSYYKPLNSINTLCRSLVFSLNLSTNLIRTFIAFSVYLSGIVPNLVDKIIDSVNGTTLVLGLSSNVFFFSLPFLGLSAAVFLFNF